MFPCYKPIKVIMEIIKMNGVKMLIPSKGKLLCVLYEDDPEPVFYERIAAWLIGENDQVIEVCPIPKD